MSYIIISHAMRRRRGHFDPNYQMSPHWLGPVLLAIMILIIVALSFGIFAAHNRIESNLHWMSIKVDSIQISGREWQVTGTDLGSGQDVTLVSYKAPLVLPRLTIREIQELEVGVSYQVRVYRNPETGVINLLEITSVIPE